MSSNASTAAKAELQIIAPLRARLFPNHEWVLLLVLVFECAIFSLVGDNFLTTSNAFEITRLSVEVGLLALALTPVIITGGIDLCSRSRFGWWWSEWTVDYPAGTATANRDAGYVFTLSRNCGRSNKRDRKLLRVF